MVQRILVWLVQALLLFGGVAAQSTQSIDTPAVQAAAKLKETFGSLDQLHVKSSQEVVFVQKRPLASDEKRQHVLEASVAVTTLPGAVGVTVLVDSEMARDRFALKMRNINSTQDDFTLDFVRVDGKPTCREAHWYPIGNCYRFYTNDKLELDGKIGVRDFKHPIGLFLTIPAPCCATGEFLRTWLGDSPQTNSWYEHLLESTFVGEENVADQKTLHFRYPVDEDSNETSYYKRLDDIWLEANSAKPVLWTTQYTHVVYGSRASYMVVKRSYTYSSAKEVTTVAGGR